jgi:hypothetical protein
LAPAATSMATTILGVWVRVALVVLHIFLRPEACPLEIHARFYIRRLANLPALVRVASQAAFGSLRGDTDDGGGAAFGLEANVKLQGTSPWPLTKKPVT